MVATTETMNAQQEKQRLYLQRVEDLFLQIKTWLPEGLTATINHESRKPVRDETGEYFPPVLTITRTDKEEPDNFVADLFPAGCSVLLAEGLVELRGAIGEEPILYMIKDNLMIDDAHGGTRPMYRGLSENGWYWLESARRSRAVLLDDEVFIDLLPLVSVYEPA